MNHSDDDREHRLRAVFSTYADRVLAYAVRHTDSDSAQDVAAEVFLTAWRRIDDLPAEPMPWLLVTARNVLANQRRATVRYLRLTDRLGAAVALAAPAPAVEDAALERDRMLGALAQLSDPDREALLLIAWDGLSNTDAAAVLGCSAGGFGARLRRARTRLDHLLADHPRPAQEVDA